MNINKCRLLILIAAFAAGAAGVSGGLFGADCAASAGGKYPARTGAVNDAAGVLRFQAEDEISSLSDNIYKTTGVDIAVLTTGGATREKMKDYCGGAFAAWMPGRKAAGGALIVFAPENPRGERVCVAADFDLNPAMTEGEAGEIAEKKVSPWADRGDYDRAAMAGALAIAQLAAKSKGMTVGAVMAPGGAGGGERKAGAAGGRGGDTGTAAASGETGAGAGGMEKRAAGSSRLWAWAVLAAAVVFAAVLFVFFARRDGRFSLVKGRGERSRGRWRGGKYDAFGGGPGMFGGYGGR